MRYPLVRNKLLRVYLYGFDFFCEILKKTFPRKKCALQEIDLTKTHRVLLRNPAAFGDVLYSLRVASALKQTYPYLEIGMMAGSWAAALLHACPAISYTHFENHWSMPTSGGRLPVRFFKYLCNWWSLRKALASKKYDIAVDLYYYFPSASFLFWSAGIPVRVGYDISGGAVLFTKTKKWVLKDQHNAEYQMALLECAGYSLQDINTTNVFCFEKPDNVFLKQYNLKNGQYAVFHIGKSDPRCEWDIEHWIASAQSVEEHGITICFTGRGAHEKELIDHVMKHLQKIHISFCNLLNITELMQIIRNAHFFVGVDSFAGHIAALYQVPQIAIMHGAANRYHWRPYHNKKCQVIYHCVECAPCYNLGRCNRSNVCMDIPAKDVISAIKRIL